MEHTIGAKGEKGQDGINGVDGKGGANGLDGKDGISITSSVVNANGELELTYSDGTTANLGTIVGKDGVNGTDGKDGTNGIVQNVCRNSCGVNGLINIGAFVGANLFGVVTKAPYCKFKSFI